MAHIQRGNERQYFSRELSGHEVSQGIQQVGNAFSNTLNNVVNVTQKANEAKLANYQVELSTRWLQKNNEINTKYQSDPDNPERERELQESFDLMAGEYKVNPLCENQWHSIKTDVYNRYKQYNAQWALRQQQTNASNDLKNGYEALNKQVAMLGMNGASVDEIRLVYANGLDGLRRGATAVLGAEVTEGFLKDSSHDVMAQYLDGLIMSNPAEAVRLLNDPNSGVLNDLGNVKTIESLRQNAQAKLLKQNEVETVNRVADYINKNQEVFNKALDGTLTTVEAQDFLSDSNVDRNMRVVLSKMLGYSVSGDLQVDAETGKIYGSGANGSGVDSAYTELVLGNKKWSFINEKGKFRQPTAQEKDEITTELYLQGSQLLNNIEGASPQDTIRKVAEFQSQVAQASYFGIDKSDYTKLMNDFVLPATASIQEEAKGYNSYIRQWGKIDNFGYKQIDKYFNNFEKTVDDTEANRKAIAKEKALASVYYWSALNNYCSQNGISMEQLRKMDRHETASVFRDCANSALQKARATSSAPQLWFRSANPQYVNRIRNLLPHSNANDVITNIAVASMSNPNMTDKDFDAIINREVRNEYAKMRTQNKSVVFGGNTKYDDLINKYSMLYGIDPLLVKCVIKQESGFNPNARSKAGAGGLMQLMPATAQGLGVKNVFDPKENISAGTKYLAGLLNQYDGNIALALSAYNAGAGNVKKYGNKIPPFKETQNYVKNILATYDSIKG